MQRQNVALICHPESRSGAVRGIHATLTRAGGALTVNYVIEGEIARLRVPPPRPPRSAEGLWQHTCCELFVARKGLAAYHELDFSPSGEWAMYAFRRYREGASDPIQSPRIAVRASTQKLELDASIDLDPGGRLALALAAVVEAGDGSLSYWALRHPPGKPDFHHPDAFALELDEIRD